MAFWQRGPQSWGTGSGAQEERSQADEKRGASKKQLSSCRGSALRVGCSAENGKRTYAAIYGLLRPQSPPGIRTSPCARALFRSGCLLFY